jgi:hypothetical protein
VRTACLTIRRLSGEICGSIDGLPCRGDNVSFSAEAMTEAGRRYERERVVFAAPHDPEFELRSTRFDA